MHFMSEASARLKAARIDAGYDTATDAAEAMGVPEQTYLAHENGSRGLSRSAARYATFYKVSLDWLVRGRGEAKPGQKHPLLKIYEEMPAQKQQQVIEYIEFLNTRT
jgi:hypothetical protein